MKYLEMAASLRMFFWGFLILIFLIACDGIKGRVEKRGNLFFLVNTSTSKKYRFTVKQTEVQDGKIYRYTTQFYELEPGEEVYIGKVADSIPATHPLKQRKVIRIEKNMTKEELLAAENERKKSNAEGGVYIPKGSSVYYHIPSYAEDTIINGVLMKYYFTTEDYYDKTITISSKSFAYKYEVKGQVEIKQ